MYVRFRVTRCNLYHPDDPLPERMPMSSQEPRTVYFLEEAFELLGMHLYGGTWTGLELTARPVDEPDGIEQRGSELDTRIKRSLDKMAAIDERINATVEAARIKELKKQQVASPRVV